MNVAKVEFDNAAADRLMRASVAAAEQLRGQGAPRRTDAENASDDFSGAYADRFADAALIESTDRPELAGVLAELSSQVRTVATEAERENERQSDLAAWKTRDADRRREASQDPLSAVKAWGDGVFDPQPSDTPIRPTPISADFSARERNRTGDGTSRGRSSADPERLRTFASKSRAADTATTSRLTDLTGAWTGFTTSCSWARIDSAAFLTGFRNLLAENAADATWVENIADAFDRAGGKRSIANAALDIAVSGRLPEALRAALAAGLSPTEVAELWANLSWTSGDAADRKDISALPLPVLAKIGNLEGHLTGHGTRPTVPCSERASQPLRQPTTCSSPLWRTSGSHSRTRAATASASW